jgi:hypothetical protein
MLIQWVESYLAHDKTFCVYLAKDKEIIRKHAEITAFRQQKLPSKEDDRPDNRGLISICAAV